MSTNETRLAPAHELVERGLSLAKDACVVIVEDLHGAEVRFANNTTTTNGLRRDRRVVVIALHPSGDGTSVGIASASGSVDVAELVSAAEHDAQGAHPAEDASPLEPAEQADGDFEDVAPATSLSVLSNVLVELNGAFRRVKERQHVLAGFAQHGLSTTYLGSSAGQRRRHVQSFGSLELVARAAADHASTWVGVGTVDFADVSLVSCEQRLVERLTWAKRSVELPAGRYEAILPPEATADFVNELLWATSGRDAEEGHSVFSAPGGGTRVGESLSELPFSLIGDPTYPGLACSPFVVAPYSSSDSSVFDNGCSIGPKTWLEEGRLASLSYHRAGARRSGVSYAPAPDNLILSLPGATASLEELIAKTDKALLLTCLWYIREVDPTTLLLTGLTRDGVYLVEKGEVVGAVNNFRFNESPVDLLRRCVEAGRSERALGRETGEWMGLTSMPTLRVPEFNMSTVSPAN